MTLLTVPVVERRLRAHEPERRLGPGLVEAAVVLALVPGDDGGLDLLFIKRAEDPGDPWSGQMAFPGGRRDLADASLLETATREALEETGIVLDPEQLLGELDDLSPVSPHLPPLVVRPFVFGLGARPQIMASDEVALHLWIPCHELAGLRVEEQVHVSDRYIVTPGFRAGPHFIWGMTDRIIMSFLRLLDMT